jgi:hypothetical protein
VTDPRPTPTRPATAAGLAEPPPYVTAALPPQDDGPAPSSRAQLAILAARLTERDRWLLRMLQEHRTLTSHQIAALAFGRLRTANRRLLILTEQLRALDRYRPRVESGSAPEHYVLGPAGALALAATRGITVKQLGYTRARTLSIALSPQLAHAVGTNNVFTALAAASRPTPGRGLTAWWSERTCLHLWGDLARPDGYGRWIDPATGSITDFFLEYDTGTENIPRLLAKLDGYARLAQTTGISTPVLFWLHSVRREAALHRDLATDPPRVPVATATAAALTEDGGAGPAGRIWRLARPNLTTRLPLAALAGYTTQARTGPRAQITDARDLAAEQQDEPGPAGTYLAPPPPLPPPPGGGEDADDGG